MGATVARRLLSGSVPDEPEAKGAHPIPLRSVVTGVHPCVTVQVSIPGAASVGAAELIALLWSLRVNPLLETVAIMQPPIPASPSSARQPEG